MFMHTSDSIIALLVKDQVSTVRCFVSHNIAGNKDTSLTFSNTIPSPIGVERKFVGGFGRLGLGLGHGTSWHSSGNERQ